MKKIIGREEEKRVLQQIYHSDKPEFLALYGRRRVGKTFLIRQFFTQKEAMFFNVTGAKNGTLLEQLKHFTKQLSAAFYDKLEIVSPKTWDSAFELLTETIKKQPKRKRIVLFFDEIPWLATRKSRLLENLDYYWNQHWSNDPRIKLVICGSSASWIIQKVIKNKGGLHNRITHKIRLEPFTLEETKTFLHHSGIKLIDQQILMLYMLTGGVPYYLSDLDKGLSAAQLIEKLAFTSKGLLFDEFDQLFSSLFTHSDKYEQLIRLIASQRQGIGQRELLNKLGKSDLGSTGIKRLEELEEAGFIMSFMPFQHKRQGIYYRAIDEYTLFYLQWIEPLKNTVAKKGLPLGSWQDIQNAAEFHNWLGYAFEAVCYKHINCIRKALKISPSAIADSWRYVPRKGAKERGAQIDLLFDRRDDAITLCEIKYTDKPFVLSKDYVEVLQRKMKVFREQTNTKKQLFMAMVSVNGLKNNFYADDLICATVTLNDFFAQAIEVAAQNQQ